MLEQCLSNFGGLGRMGEHFVPYVYRARRNALVRLANRLLGEERLPPRFRLVLLLPGVEATAQFPGPANDHAQAAVAPAEDTFQKGITVSR